LLNIRKRHLHSVRGGEAMALSRIAVICGERGRDAAAISGMVVGNAAWLGMSPLDDRRYLVAAMAARHISGLAYEQEAG